MLLTIRSVSLPANEGRADSSQWVMHIRAESGVDGRIALCSRVKWQVGHEKNGPSGMTRRHRNWLSINRPITRERSRTECWNRHVAIASLQILTTPVSDRDRANHLYVDTLETHFGGWPELSLFANSPKT